MKNYGNYNGVLLVEDENFAGQLNISGPESVAKLVGTNFWPVDEAAPIDIHGVLADGRKASLLGCVRSGRIQHGNGKAESSFFPHYIIIGEEFVHSSQPVIRAVRYHFTNVFGLVSGARTFELLQPDASAVRRLLKEDHERSEKIAENHGWTKRPFEPEIGEHPVILYFSGVHEIIAFDTSGGRISLKNRASYGPGGATGIGVNNEVVVNIEFFENKTLSVAIRALYTLHGLLELCLGHRQRYQWIELELPSYIKDTDVAVRQTVQLYWSLCNQRVEGEAAANLHDVLLSPDRRSSEFSNVVAGWMDSSATMSDPRGRFATAFFSSSYSIDRIVGAANMFDLLPQDRAPKGIESDAQTKEAVAQCRDTFRKLPSSFARESVLSALARVGKASLRNKVRYRADKILSVAGDKFPELYLPCDQAVLARNHYVHGSEASFDYRIHIVEFAFIIDTLEFVFAASDLLDLGWDLNNWMCQGTTMTHAFGVYRVNFQDNMRRLKAVLPAKREEPGQ